MADPKLARRLAAIFAADMVGYSRLMEADEEGVIARQKQHRKQLIDPKIADHNGRIVKTTGDGMLVEFASAVDAVKCAAEIQSAMAGREQDVPEDHRITYRVGINIGDIVIDGDDILGNGVNVAARLEALCEPGGIYVSGTVYDHIDGKIEASFEDLGEQTVKNIAKPVRVYRMHIDGAAGAADGAVDRPVPDDAKATAANRAPALELPAKPSIAVLPFDNMSNDPEQEFFADGITEDIITELSRFMSLFVIARNSTFAFKGQPIDVKEVGRKLGVRYVVEGSVRTAGKRLRITAQLIDAVNDTHLWAERYDRELEDVFDVQDEVTRAIVTAIEPQLASTERERARRKPPESLDAWECYQRGLWHLYRHKAEDSAKGQDLFRRAIEHDPGFAPPHAALAFSLYYDVVGGLVSDPGDRLERALDEARAAIAADERDAFAHEVLARTLLMCGEHDASIAAHKTSLRLNPNYANAHHGLAFALCFTGQPEDALREFDEAMRLSPHDPLMWAFQIVKSFALTLLKRYDEALVWAKRSQQSPDASVWAYFGAAISLVYLDRMEEAREALQKAFAIKPDMSKAYFEQIFNFKNPEDMAHVMTALHKAGLPE
jgi:adenylate cyclase